MLFAKVVVVVESSTEEIDEDKVLQVRCRLLVVLNAEPVVEDVEVVAVLVVRDKHWGRKSAGGAQQCARAKSRPSSKRDEIARRTVILSIVMSSMMFCLPTFFHCYQRG